MQRSQTNFLFLNIGHFLAHYFMLIFATAAALRLTTEWGLSYAELIPYATPAFVAFGLGAIPAGWLADKWSRQGMMVTFFLGIGASAVIAGMADSPSQIGFGLLLIGIFAAIYHPVGLAMVVHGRIKTGIPLAINGVFGNMGVASAALFTGFLIDTSGWRSAFVLSGLASILLGMLYLLFLRTAASSPTAAAPSSVMAGKPESRPIPRRTLLNVFGVIFFTAAMGGLVFQSTTFTLPKVLAERLAESTATATMIGGYAFLVFSLAAFAQLVVGYLIDKHSVRSVFAWVALLQALFFFVMTQIDGVLSVFVAIAFMLAVFGQVPINDVLVGRMARSEWHSRAFAARYIVTFSVSATAVPLIAWIHGAWGFNTLFGLLTVAALLIFLAVLILPKP